MPRRILRRRDGAFGNRQCAGHLRIGQIEQGFEGGQVPRGRGQRVGHRDHLSHGRLLRQPGQPFAGGGRLAGQPLCAGRDRLRRRLSVVRRVGQIPAGLRHRQQMPAQIAAVHRGNVHRQQRLGGLRVVPVQQMASVTTQPVQGGQRGIEPCQQLLGADPPELPGAGRAQQIKPDVGGRGSVRHHVVRRGLQVVRGQVVVLFGHAAFEQSPRIACHALEIGPLRGRQIGADMHRMAAADPPDPQRRGAPYQAQGESQPQVRAARKQQRTRQHPGSQRFAPVLASQRGQPAPGRGLGRRSRRPLQQQPMTDRQTVQTADDRVERQPRLREQLNEVPQPARQRARQVHRGLAIEVLLGQIIPARREPGDRAHQRAGAKAREDQSQRRPGRNHRHQQGQHQQGERHRRHQ